MAITRNNTQSSSTSTLLYTPPSVTDGCLVVIVSSEDVGNNEPITGVSFGSNAMVVESVGQGIIGTNSNDIAIAYLVNPGITEESISVAGGQQDRMGIVAVTLDNVDQSSPVNASNGSFSTAAVSVFPTSETTTLDGCYVISGGTGESTGGSLSVSGATEFIEFTPPSSRLAAADSTQASSGLYSHSWSTSSPAGRYSSASVAFNLAAGGLTAAADISISKPVFSAQSSVTTPPITSTISVEILAPIFSASSSVTLPSPQSALDISIAKPIFNSTAVVTLPSSTSNIDITINKPVFGVSSSVTLPQPSADASISVSKPLFSVTAEVTDTALTSNIDISIDKPVFSAQSSVTLPRPNSTVQFTVSEPVFSAFATVSGLNIIVADNAKITLSYESNKITLQAKSNKLII